MLGYEKTPPPAKRGNLWNQQYGCFYTLSSLCVCMCVCRKPAWLTPSATTPPLTPPICTSCAVTSSTCWTARAPWAGGGAVGVGWGSFRRRASGLFTSEAISPRRPSQPWRWPSDSCVKAADPVISSGPVRADLAVVESKPQASRLLLSLPVKPFTPKSTGQCRWTTTS